MSAGLYRKPLDLEANRLFAEDFRRLARAGEAMGFPPLPTKRVPVAPPVVDEVAEQRRRDVLFIASPRDGSWSLGELLEVAAATAGLPAIQLRADRREQGPTRARQTYCWLARRFTEASLVKIGHQIGGRDHTTVMHAIGRAQEVADAIETPPALDDPRPWADAILSAEWLPSKKRDPRWGGRR